jgi:2-dehydropantoate 2-reductase
MAIDYVNGRALEVEAILGEPLRRGLAAGVSMPTVATLYALVHAADLRNRGMVATIGSR